jgi:hypothetical protein
LNEHLASVALKQFPITLLIAARAKHRGFKTEEQELAYNLHVIGASQLHMQWGVTLSSFRQDQASHDNRAGLSRHREQALDELALAGEDSSLRRQLRITSRSNWAKDRSTLSVSRPNTDKMGLFCPSGASLPDEFRCNSSSNSSSSVRRALPGAAGSCTIARTSSKPSDPPK